MTSATRTALVAGAALSMLISTASFAQPGRAPEGGPAAMGERGPGKGWGMRRHRDPEAHAKHLRDVLQLRPDQEPALQAFLTAMAPPEGKGEKMREGRKAMDGLTTPERLDRQAARMAEHQAAFARRAEATKRFYGALTPAQQKAFDAMHPGRGGKMGRGMGGGMGRMHGGG